MNKKLITIGFSLALMIFATAEGCENTTSTPRSSSGVKKATTTVNVGTDGLTVEQRNITARLKEDNTPGAIKHLYVISPYSGEVIIYSTVKGKVTSGGKRLTPQTVSAIAGQCVGDAHEGFPIDINGQNKYTSEVLQDDGSYGNSSDYLYWWDVNGRYFQLPLPTPGIIMITSQPLPIKHVSINVTDEK